MSRKVREVGADNPRGCFAAALEEPAMMLENTAELTMRVINVEPEAHTHRIILGGGGWGVLLPDQAPPVPTVIPVFASSARGSGG